MRCSVFLQPLNRACEIIEQELRPDPIILTFTRIHCATVFKLRKLRLGTDSKFISYPVSHLERNLNPGCKQGIINCLQIATPLSG